MGTSVSPWYLVLALSFLRLRDAVMVKQDRIFR
jgi:hypothetical protein